MAYLAIKKMTKPFQRQVPINKKIRLIIKCVVSDNSSEIHFLAAHDIDKLICTQDYTWSAWYSSCFGLLLIDKFIDTAEAILLSNNGTSVSK